MAQKKPYESPRLYRVELDVAQAVLTACSLMTVSAASGSPNGCRSGGFIPCKGSFLMFGTDSGGRPS